MIPPLMKRQISYCLLIAVLLIGSAALAQMGTGPQFAPDGMGATPPPPPDPTPPGQPVYAPTTSSYPPAGAVSSPPAQSWPPPAQPALQPTTPYVPSDGSSYPPATPYVPSDQTYQPPGTYLVGPAQPAYGGPAPWLGDPSPGLGLIPGPGNPRWDVSVDALWLTRDTGKSVLLGYSQYNDSSHASAAVQPDSLWSDDELFPMTPGARLQLVGRINDRMTIETTCWGFHDWSIGRTIYGDPAGESVLAHSTWLQMPDIDDTLGYTYSSQISNVELNQRFRLLSFDPYRGLAWLWGVRYLHLADDLTLTGSDQWTGGHEVLEWQTKNNLIGAQLGLQWAWGCDRFQLSTEAKVGLFANAYSQHGTDSATAVDGFQPFDVSHNGTDLAALFELSILLRVRVTSCAWLRLGYQYYGVTGVALGPGQLADYDAAGSVGFDGLSLGAEVTF